MTIHTPPSLTSFIGGATSPHEGAALDLIRPSDGRVGARLVEAGKEGVAAAVADAARAFHENRRSTLHQRSQWLRAMAATLADAAEEFALIVSQDVGKPIRPARFESKRGAEFLEACAASVLHLAGEMVPVDAAPLGAGHLGF